MFEVKNLLVCHGPRKNQMPAVNNVSFCVYPGERIGLVGESGSGKTSLGRAMLGLIPCDSGTIKYSGLDVTRLRGRDLRSFRQAVQMVFQDPLGSLNPRMTIRAALDEPLQLHFSMSSAQRRTRVSELLCMVELDPALADRYPHEFSGGQRQRISIARALATKPSLLIADEPVSALDVSVQAQILNLLLLLCTKQNCALLLIAHDLAVVRAVCERMMVMYQGRIMEAGPSHDVLRTPLHPYTATLLKAVPDIRKQIVPETRMRHAVNFKHELLLNKEPELCCAWLPRCECAGGQCALTTPDLRRVSSQRQVACHCPFTPDAKTK